MVVCISERRWSNTHRNLRDCLVIYEVSGASDASNVTKHTLLGLEHFATRSLGALDRANAARLFIGLHKKVKMAIELICADAAAKLC